ncbi:MAG: hypothetical protein K2X93_18715 [Candidatus Obscuribacterales bacterium]|nr:hypothetical protein [Candidatus Obscuribacterales bacterium]
MPSKYFPCPCSSKTLYHKCCKAFHDGQLPTKAVDLMKSRYSAYALNLPEYIISTTHKDNPNCKADHEEWKADLQNFSSTTQFDSLQIEEFVDGEETATVMFKASLRQAGQDASFREKSTFVKQDERWLYRSGEILKDVGGGNANSWRTDDAWHSPCNT